MQPLLNIGVRAARRAGDIIVRNINRLDSIKISSKGRNDFVSEVDRQAEADIIATVRRSYPDHAFLAGRIDGFYSFDRGPCIQAVGLQDAFLKHD